jgi:hypothetical protein
MRLSDLNLDIIPPKPPSHEPVEPEWIGDDETDDDEEDDDLDEPEPNDEGSGLRPLVGFY